MYKRQHIGHVATFAAFVLAIKFVACIVAASFLKIPGRMGIIDVYKRQLLYQPVPVLLQVPVVEFQTSVSIL